MNTLIYIIMGTSKNSGWVFRYFLVCAFITTVLVFCEKKPIIPQMELSAPETNQLAEEMETVFTIPEDGETREEVIEDDDMPRRIIVPYTREYLSLGQETRITVYLENADYGDEMGFNFTAESGKNSIEVEGIYNVAIIKAVGEGEQNVQISHPKAQADMVIIYDVLPAAPPLPPEIDVSESPMLISKDETKLLRMMLLNGKAADQEKFKFKVVENAYAIEVKQYGGILSVTGIAPGAGKIRITNPAALRDYDVMVIVD